MPNLPINQPLSALPNAEPLYTRTRQLWIYQTISQCAAISQVKSVEHGKGGKAQEPDLQEAIPCNPLKTARLCAAFQTQVLSASMHGREMHGLNAKVLEKGGFGQRVAVGGDVVNVLIVGVEAGDVEGDRLSGAVENGAVVGRSPMII